MKGKIFFLLSFLILLTIITLPTNSQTTENDYWILKSVSCDDFSLIDEFHGLQKADICWNVTDKDGDRNFSQEIDFNSGIVGDKTDMLDLYEWTNLSRDVWNDNLTNQTVNVTINPTNETCESIPDIDGYCANTTNESVCECNQTINNRYKTTEYYMGWKESTTDFWKEADNTFKIGNISITENETKTFKAVVERINTELLGTNNWKFSIKILDNGLTLQIDPWWNSSWLYRREIQIEEKSGNNLTNFSVLLKIPWNSNIQSDFDDLRFTWLNESTEVEIYYFIKNYTTSDNASVWIKVPYIPADDNATVYMYYGNPIVGNKSDAPNTFYFYDDFDDGDHSDWYLRGGISPSYCSISETGGRLKITALTSISACPYLNVKNFTMMESFRVDYNMFTHGTHIYFASGAHVYDYNSSGYLSQIFAGNDWWRNAWWSLIWGVSSTVGSFHNDIWLNVTYISSWSETLRWGYTTNGIDSRNESNPPHDWTTADYFNVELYTARNTNDYAFFDNFTIRGYADPEPDYSIGSEEMSNIAPQVTLVSPDNATYINNNTPPFTFHLEDDQTNGSCELFLTYTTSYTGDAYGLWNVSHNPSGSFDNATAVAVDNDGNYIIVGYDSSGGYQWRIEKRNPTDGSSIWNVTSRPTGGGIAYDVAIDNDGNYVVAGVGGGNGGQWRIEKIYPNGTSILNITSNPSSGDDYAQSIAIDNDGNYVIVGVERNVTGNNDVWRIEKRYPNGTSVWNVSNDFSIGHDRAYGVAVDNDGNYVIVGNTYISGSSVEWMIEKRNSTNGNLIWNITTNYSSYPFDEARDVAVDNDGYYVVVGWSAEQQLITDSDWRIEKRHPNNGSLVWNASTRHVDGEAAYSIAIDTDGNYIVAGFNRNTTGYIRGQWRTEKRSSVNGSLMWSISSDPSPYIDTAYDVAVDNGNYVVVGDDYITFPSDREWRIEVYSTTYTTTFLEGFGINQTSMNCTNTTIVANHTISDGTYDWFVNCTDPLNLTNQSDIRVITIDTIPPVIAIISPQNTTYATKTIDLKVIADETIDTWIYNLNGTNVTFTPNTTINATEGSNTLIVYANDTAGNLNTSSVTFTVDTTPPTLLILSYPEITRTSVEISVLFNELSNLSITLQERSETKTSTSFKFSHTITFDGLKENTTYHITLNFCDQYGNCGNYSSTFTTASEKKERLTAYYVFVDKCGNGICDAGYGEDYYSCPEDCPKPVTLTVCGNGICEFGENTINCPTDCGLAPMCTDWEFENCSTGSGYMLYYKRFCVGDYEIQTEPVDCCIADDCPETQVCQDNFCIEPEFAEINKTCEDKTLKLFITYLDRQVLKTRPVDCCVDEDCDEGIECENYICQTKIKPECHFLQYVKFGRCRWFWEDWFIRITGFFTGLLSVF